MVLKAFELLWEVSVGDGKDKGSSTFLNFILLN